MKRRSHREKSLKYECNYQYFDRIDSEDQAYFLGFIYADGFITEDIFGIAIKEEDIDVLEKLKKYMGSTYPIHYYENNGFNGKYKPTKYCRVMIRSKEIVDCLQKQGVFYRKSYCLKEPHIQKELIRHFIRGYMDGDGSIYTSQNSSTVSFTGTLDILKFIGDYFVECGIIRQYKLYPEHHSDFIYSLKVGGNIQSRTLLNHLYDEATVYMNRKYNTYLNLIEKSS